MWPQEDQEKVCSRLSAEFCPIDEASMLGVSEGVLKGEQPVHGLRHPSENGTCGWYLWTGEFSDTDDFFQPLHVSHLYERKHAVIPYLGLPPGWRFLIADQYEDVWFDAALLDT
jgi:hypothetical protein